MRTLVRCLLLLVVAAPLRAGSLREVEISSEPEKDGRKVFTLRLLPAETLRCDKLVYECVLHQEFPWIDMRGRKSTKIHEPASFTYREKNVRFVNDLDYYANFRVPVGLERLERMYGAKVFNKDYPVTVSRIRLTAFVKGEQLWSYEIPARGTHQAATLRASLEEKPEDDEDLSDLPDPEIPFAPRRRR